MRRGTLAELTLWVGEREPKGEIVVVVAGADAPKVDLDSVAREAATRADSGERLKTVVAELAEATGLRRKDLYAAALARRADRQ